MIYHINQIIKDVKVALDLNADSDALVEEGDIDTLTMDEIILSHIEDGARRVLEEAPIHLLGRGHTLDGLPIAWEPGREGCGSILLPDDFLRLIVFEMSDWERPVYTPISSESAEYAHQRSRFKGVRGTPQRPIVALTATPTGRHLEFYSSRDNSATVSRGAYQPRPKIDSLSGIDLPQECYRAIVLMIAQLTEATFATAGGGGGAATSNTNE